MSASPQTTNGKKPRILVAEDSPLNREVALKQLEALGYDADGVADGSQAVEAFKNTAYDVVLMDCQMPVTNGYDATMLIRLREDEQRAATASARRTYIVAMTANAEADNRDRCLAAGMDDFIHKPVQLPELDAVLRRAFLDRATAQEMDAVIDPVIIAGLRQLRSPGQPDPLAGFIDLFLREAPGQLDTLSKAVTDKNIDALSRFTSAASALKGSAGNLGARNLAALVDEIEQMGRNWGLTDTGPIIERAKEEFQRAKTVLEKIKNS